MTVAFRVTYKTRTASIIIIIEVTTVDVSKTVFTLLPPNFAFKFRMNPPGIEITTCGSFSVLLS